MSDPGAGAPLLEAEGLCKSFGRVPALDDVSMSVRAGEIVCVLGDNGAGKSTLIKTLSGVHPPDRGHLRVGGERVRFSSPRDALTRGIATVYQDLALVPLLSVARNFVLGAEPTRGFWPLRRFDLAAAGAMARDALRALGIELRDMSAPVGTLSGGERQCVAIARALHFGAQVLILDEPTSALGVKQAGIVLRTLLKARDRGSGVILVTHNPHHAHLVGDRFAILSRGRCPGMFSKGEIWREELARQMAGGEEIEALAHELEGRGRG